MIMKYVRVIFWWCFIVFPVAIFNRYYETSQTIGIITGFIAGVIATLKVLDDLATR